MNVLMKVCRETYGLGKFPNPKEELGFRSWKFAASFSSNNFLDVICGVG
ncbi:Protein of unknown function [Pyronema omphalodes CBS 100304]|uniref:Uncharacterized protein n=1 Tax=Pyronema omphalodes (strain CBS 100304) TaxID=1076935 RepID=U4L2S5_PYROM|nr:Protein of unknown function [Pyronema omphalodes CBS 100304]